MSLLTSHLLFHYRFKLSSCTVKVIDNFVLRLKAARIQRVIALGTNNAIVSSLFAIASS
jgi:hypothetical protein